MQHNEIALKVFDILFLATLFIVSFWLQRNVFLNHDVSWHILGAQRMLSGADYLHGVFDDNPPMVFWFYIPLIRFTQYFPMSIITAQILYVLLITLFSFWLCHIFLNRLYEKENPLTLGVTRFSIALILLFFPLYTFGQREVLLTAFCLPYIILMGVRMHSAVHSVFKPALLAWVGFWLACGVALNPLYGLIVVALEIQLWATTKKMVLVRPEIIVFTVCCVFYLLAIYHWYLSYYTTVIPAILTFSPGYNFDWTSLVFDNFYAVLFFITTVVFILAYSLQDNRRWLLTLWLAAGVSFFIYVINKKVWYYHIFPFVAFCSLLLITLLLDLIKIGSDYSFRARVMGLLSVIALLCLSLIFIVSDVKLYEAYHTKDYVLRQLIDFFNREPTQHRSFYVFSTRVDPEFPLIDYTTLRYLPDRPDCWVIPVIVKNTFHPNTSGWRFRIIQNYKEKFVTDTITAFQKQKPYYVLVDEHQYLSYLGYIPFNFIDFLSQNDSFKAVWHHYRLQKKIGAYAIYARQK